MSTLSAPRHSYITWALRITGSLAIVAGLQTWAFDRYATPLVEQAARQLLHLQEEVSGNRLIDTALGSLREYWQATDDPLRKRQVTGLRDEIMRGLRDNPRVVIEEAVRVVNGFDAGSPMEIELLAAIQEDLSRLQAVYTDHYAAAMDAYTNAPLYLQPIATLQSFSRSKTRKLDFNHAIYLMLVGDRSSANAVYTNLRQNSSSGEFESRVLYAQARLQFDAFQVENDPGYYEQALQYTRQSLQSDATYDLPKLFLEYLLAMDQQAVEVESSPQEGEGSGESEGERGAISTGSKEH